MKELIGKTITALRVNEDQSILGTAEETRAALDSKDAEIAQLKAKLNECADKALTYAASYEMAAARLVVAMGYMPPEQKRAFSAAWTEKRAELKPPWIEGLTPELTGGKAVPLNDLVGRFISY